MGVKDLVFHPDPILRQRAEPVTEFDQELARLLDDLSESMYFHMGVGLAAQQIGVCVRAAVVDVDQRDGAPRLIELVNPEVIDVSDEKDENEEGCLSFPEESEMVVRPARATVKALDRHGQPFEITAEGLLGRAIQHEIDHLDGTLFIDHLSRLKRSLVERRMKKHARWAAD